MPSIVTVDCTATIEVPALDAEGGPLYGPDVPVLDADGRPVLDTDGQPTFTRGAPIMKIVPAPPVVREMTADEATAFTAHQAAVIAQAQVDQQAAAQAQAAADAQRASDLATLQAAVAGTPLADPNVLAAFQRLATGT